MYVLARTASKRPTLQHRLVSGEDGSQLTACGLDVTQWSRAYQNKSIPQILCIRCTKSDK